MNLHPSTSSQIDRLRESAGHLRVSSILNHDDWRSDALYDLAAGNRTQWTPEDWRTLLRDLRRSPGTLADWLDLNT